MPETLEWSELFVIAFFRGQTTGIPMPMYIYISPEVAEYLYDIGRSTDEYELGGYLLGKQLEIEPFTLVQLYDYIQAPNVAENPSESFRPYYGITKEIARKIVNNEYNAVSRVHTHPRTSAPSPADWVVLVSGAFNIAKALSEITGIDADTCIRFALKVSTSIPDFTIMGRNGGGLAVSFGFIPHEVLWGFDNKFSNPTVSTDDYQETVSKDIAENFGDIYDIVRYFMGDKLFMSHRNLEELKEATGRIAVERRSYFNTRRQFVRWLRTRYSEALEKNTVAAMLIDQVLSIVKYIGHPPLPEHVEDTLNRVILQLEAISPEDAEMIKGAIYDIYGLEL